ncbi:MAG: RraA family protein [Planctomycetota bacterium]|jgi:regulator of RNase E activity RraA|nr:RraA family protein [Planctomycetota bacterium]
MSDFNADFRPKFASLSASNIADALDALGLRGATYGIRPMWESAGKVLGPAVTLRLTPVGATRSETHLGVRAVEAAKAGDIVVIDNGGRLDASCWGGILANGAKMKGVGGVVVDGAVRDVDDCVEIGFPAYARGSVVATARGRVQEESTNSMIQFAGVQVRPGDIVMGDRSGVVIIPREKLEETLAKAGEFRKREEEMVAEIRAGASMLEVDGKFNYEGMLRK